MRVFRKFIWALVIFLFLLGSLYFFHKPLLTLYARTFVFQNAKPGANAIICLSGSRQTRTPECLSCGIRAMGLSFLLPRKSRRMRSFTIWELSHLQFAREVTKRMRMMASWELLPSLSGGATSTFDEAEDALAYAKRAKWKRIILVTDEFHTRRAHLAFKKVFQASDVEVQVAGAPNEVFAIDDWWKSDRGILAFFGETIKFPIYWFWDHEPKLVKND